IRIGTGIRICKKPNVDPQPRVSFLFARSLAEARLLPHRFCRPCALRVGQPCNDKPDFHAIRRRSSGGEPSFVRDIRDPLGRARRVEGMDRDQRRIGVCINTKFSAVPMFALLCAFTCLASYKQQQFWGLLSTAAILGAIGLIAIAGLGYAPYLRNLFEHGHIFYPLMGSDGECPGRCMEAEPLRALSPVKRFFFSLFAETHGGFATEMRLKLPFTFAIPEFRAAGGSETRIAGFGPFYSGALMVALATTCVIAFRYSRNAMVGYAALLLAAILISVAVLPENWWARYVPQLWLVPVVIAATAIYLNVRMLRIAGWLIVLTMLVNSTAAFAANVWLTAKRHRAVDAQIGQLRKEDAQNCVY